nr:spermatid-specific linker histone H1-like protein [Castor canadensis]
MQKDTSPVPPSMPLASNTAMGGSWEASASGVSNKSETGPRTCPKACPKPSMSKVILRTVADKGVHSRVSLAVIKKALTTTGYNMARNTRRFKRVLQKLVEKGLLKQVTGKRATGSFRLGKKQPSKSRLKAKRRQQQRRRQQRRQRGQCQSGQCQSRQRRSLLGSRQSRK